MSQDAELARAFRRYMAGQDRAPGAVIPESTGSQAVPIHDGRRGDVDGRAMHGRTDTYPDRDDRGPAHRGSPNDYGHRRQDRLAMGGYREEMVFAPAEEEGAIVTLDTTRAAMWWVDAVGSVTIQILDPEPPEFLDEFVEEPKQAELITVWIVRNQGANIIWPADWMWSSEIRGGSIGSDNPFAGATSDAQIDCYTVMRIPDRGTFAFVGGRKFS